MQHRAIIANHRRLADDDAGGMVEHDALADHRGRVDVDLQEARGQALQIQGKVLAAGLPQRVRDAIGLERMKALEIEQGLDQAARGRVAFDRGHEVGAERLAERGIRGEHLVKRLVQQA